jgi:hypothetical protein
MIYDIRQYVVLYTNISRYRLFTNGISMFPSVHQEVAQLLLADKSISVDISMVEATAGSPAGHTRAKASVSSALLRRWSPLASNFFRISCNTSSVGGTCFTVIRTMLSKRDLGDRFRDFHWYAFLSIQAWGLYRSFVFG